MPVPTQCPASLGLAALLAQLRESPGLRAKHDIQAVVQPLAEMSAESFYRNGDDAAVLPSAPHAQAHQLLAMEGFMNEFVAADPWFAGWCGVMVNVSDIAAMGGTATAVVNALWSGDAATAESLMRGMVAACNAFNVPLVGGHTNLHSNQAQLAVAIVGSATKILSSFDAAAGHDLLVVVDLRGRLRPPFLNWNAATDKPVERLRGDYALLRELAERELAICAKDISQAGVLGTILMLLECSAVGATVDLQSLPKPREVAWLEWLQCFPSFGFVLTCEPRHTREIGRLFEQRGIAARRVGSIEVGSELTVRCGDQKSPFWDWRAAPLMGIA